MKNIKRSDIYFANLDPTVGKEIKKTRPVLIISNDIIMLIPISLPFYLSHLKPEKIYPFEVLFSKEESGLVNNSKIKCKQIRTIAEMEHFYNEVIFNPVTFSAILYK